MGTTVAKSKLLNEIEDMQKTVRSSVKCRMCQILDDTDGEMHQALETALANTRINASTIGKWVRTKGFRCSDYSVRRHRRGECQ